MSDRRIAILIDGGFFLRRLRKLVAEHRCDTPEGVVRCIRQLCRTHVRLLTGHSAQPQARPDGSRPDTEDRWISHVYRIFYYDAQPYDGKSHHPIANREINYAKSDLANERRSLFDLLRRQRKVALRLGKVNQEHSWTINPRRTKELLKTRQALEALPAFALPADVNAEVLLTLSAQAARQLLAVRDLWAGLQAEDVSLGLRQKGVDMRIGIDIASLALKKQVDTIVLVAGDSDFVPAAKLARREGIDFVLDPMWQSIQPDLHEHIDGLQSGLPKPTATPTADAATASAVPTTDPEQANGP